MNRLTLRSRSECWAQAAVVVTPPQPDSGPSPAAKTTLTSVVGAQAATPAAEVPPIPNAPRRRLLGHADAAALAAWAGMMDQEVQDAAERKTCSINSSRQPY